MPLWQFAEESDACKLLLTMATELINDRLQQGGRWYTCAVSAHTNRSSTESLFGQAEELPGTQLMLARSSSAHSDAVNKPLATPADAYSHGRACKSGSTSGLDAIVKGISTATSKVLVRAMHRALLSSHSHCHTLQGVQDGIELFTQGCAADDYARLEVWRCKVFRK